ncbi:MAG: energy-coupling factor transporter transmembrane protein EcfT [Methanobrevibacter sp.]|uniref:Energy-coupling factor transporter transmembrane protein EcfT n=1 Tax=Methanobrevibacter millerae TaxID=230361 RepID=A0A8T3VCX3_9EURY|nr:energy-coupling factor transporter transmembrane component T [Methanobrevibacter millerae]MBE6505002.1 energy-coupling factor transporter transmembrane protein EcfT [Methanobrevibacter millerae]MBR0059271.1 energy-coupling factor transporter transmembrane protein EcfT [Methanobrevibacter sp.]MBR0370815.1 energy-coupling factor transporter transmembrane protein EcfT [Methanobrevibacter sp.]
MELGLDNQFKIDPRTKIILLVIISFMVFNEAPLYVSGILVLVPFICLFFSDYKKAAIIYIFLYVIARYIQIYLLPNTTGIVSILLVTFSYTASRMLPIFVMGYYTITSTKVSEFIASMEKSNVPKEIIIPISVIFRYIPSVYEEIKSITNAMKMRGFGFTTKSLKSPLKLIEFYMVPILISAVKTSDELSAASLTRGLSNPEKRTHLIDAEFNKWDYILLIVSIIGLGIYSYYFIGGVVLA